MGGEVVDVGAYIESVGGRLHGFWYAFGSHDGYNLWEARRRQRRGVRGARGAHLADGSLSEAARMDLGLGAWAARVLMAAALRTRSVRAAWWRATRPP